MRRALTVFAWLLPALLLALVAGHAVELVAGSRLAADPDTTHLLVPALWSDLLALIKGVPALFLLSLPALALPPGRRRLVIIGVLWSLPVVVQALLGEYFLTTRVPLGADLFGYSWGELRTTVVAGAVVGPRVGAVLLLPLLVLWASLAWLGRRVPERPRAGLGILLLGVGVLGAWTLPTHADARRFKSQDGYYRALNKTGFLVGESLDHLRRKPPVATAPPALTQEAGGKAPPLDPEYPFLHPEQTPDTLGPLFDSRPGDPPPDLVFILVEGLGRSFSGPGARLGSFTPFLDELATRSLYWDNFLAVQGRTFAALPSVFGSLPFGEQGFAALDARMPAHATLLGILRHNGYRLGFYAGFDPDFDNERQFLLRQGVDRIVGPEQFGARYRRANDWGYADGELIDRVLEDAVAAPQGAPTATVIQTVTLHTPYTFPGQEAYAARLEQRLDALGIDAAQRAPYRQQRAIYESILYADDVLRRYFDQASRLPGYANTVFVVTGDHRLPEIPMDTRIERYHVPLLIHSPRLKAPLRIRSVSSQFDIAPSLLAYLANHHGLETPSRVAWLGTGLDTEPAFRNVHAFPLKQTKGNLVDFVSGRYFLNQGALYVLRDGMEIEPVEDGSALQQVTAEFDRFRAANDRFARTLALMPGDVPQDLVAYREQQRTPMPAPAPPGLTVERVELPASARAGAMEVAVTFANGAPVATASFVPLLVLSDAAGREVSETYAPPMALASGRQARIRVPVKSAGVPAGPYFLAVIPSHPATGKPMGEGRYRIAITLQE